MLAAETDIWRFQSHPEVWLIVAAIIGFGWWITRVIGPKAVAAGEPIVTKRHKVSFVLALGLLWLASDWPMHDIAEEYLYSVHMVQHLLISLVIPPLFLRATPEWLARLIVSGDGKAGIWIRRLTRPVVAGAFFNLLVALTHLTWVVNTSAENGVFHYFVHLLVFTTALLMWMPVMSPLPELRVSLPGQMLYLFLMSVLPTVPGGFLTFAEGALYEVYDHSVRIGGMTVTDDQQAAGLIMKLVGGTYIWTIITILFFRWMNLDEQGRPQEEPVLTYTEVQAAFAEAGDPVPEGRSGRPPSRDGG